MNTIRLIIAVETDNPETLHIFPELILIQAKKWIVDNKDNTEHNYTINFAIVERCIWMYEVTKHIRYIFMLYMLLQEIEEIEIASTDEIPPKPGNPNYDELYAKWRKAQSG